MKTLSQILIDVNSYLDLSAELPTDDDLAVRTNFAKQAVEEWASAYRWRELKESTTVFMTGATLSLGTNFRELVYPPHETSTTQYTEVMSQERLDYGAAEKYCYIRGNTASGKYLIFNGIPAAGATLSFDWQRYPSNFASLSSVCEVPDSDFVRLKVISYVLQSRLDERFPIVDSEAKRILTNMIGREMVQAPGGSLTVRRAGAAAWGLGRRNG